MINGGAWKQSEYVNEGIPVVQVSNMKNGTIDISDLKFISTTSYDRYKIHALKENDLVIATVGSHATQASAAGRATIVKDFAAGMLLNQNAVAIRSKSKALDQRYLGLLGRSAEFQSYLSIVGKGAANQVRIALSSIRQYKCDLPPVRTQQRIAEIISAYDDLIDNNRRRIALLEQAARLLYREWFVRLRFPGHEHVRIEDGVPEGWESRTLGDLCEEVRESVKPDAFKSNTPYIGLEHMPRRSISLGEWGIAGQVTSSKHRFLEGDILFGKIRPYFHKVGVAFVDGIASSDAIVIRPNSSTLHGLVLMTVSSDAFVALTAQTMREGSKMPRADWKQMQAYSVPLPPDGLLDIFKKLIDSIIDQLKTLTHMNNRVRTARDLLLPRLMNGEIAI